MITGLVLSFVFIGLALYEVLTSRRIHRTEKLLWTLGFLFTGGLAGLLYLLSERRRIAAV